MITNVLEQGKRDNLHFLFRFIAMIANFVKIPTKKTLGFQFAFEFIDTCIRKIEGKDGEQSGRADARDKIIICKDVLCWVQTYESYSENAN